jgi:DNA-binding NarL/FixJ family response regulator
VRDLVAGDGLQYVAAGVHSLKGVPGRWSLYEVATSAPPKQRPTKKTMPRRAAEPKARKAISVVVVDDHPLWRQTLRSVVESDGAAKVVAEASDGSEATAVIADARPDVVLMDMDMPSMHGVDATAAVVAAVPSTKVLVLSASDDPDVVLAAVRAGASGYLLKTADGAEIRTALRRVAAGELAFPSQLSEVVLQGLRQPPPGAPGDSGLTARELEVLDLMAEGLSNQAIGKRLFLSGKTVEAHVSTIFTKLGIEPTDDVNRRVRAVVAHLSTRHAAARSRGSSRGHL